MTKSNGPIGLLGAVVKKQKPTQSLYKKSKRKHSLLFKSVAVWHSEGHDSEAQKEQNPTKTGSCFF